MSNRESALEVIKWLEENEAPFVEMSDEIWACPELAWMEFKSSRIQADYFEKEGFKVTWDVGGLNTAFVAEWGEGKPVLGFIGEYDALPGLSQKVQPTKEPVEDGGAGHGCGHNLLGVGTVASTVAVQKWLDASGTAGTVRYYGCPAEEKGSGKVFMGRAGAFEDLDAALNYHPGSINMAGKGIQVGVRSIYYRFYGRTAHAGGAPHLGRSALDAVELMNVGVNYMREHVKDDVRIHYIITEGGLAPNIVPEEAEVYYFIRAAEPEYLEEVVERVRKIAEGAAMMTETRVELHSQEGCSAVMNNHYLADMQYEAMNLIGPISYTQEELDFAQTINDAFPGTNADYAKQMIEYLKPTAEHAAFINEYRDEPIDGRNYPSLDERVVRTGSTDVGDVSQIVPVSKMSVTCFPKGVPGHSWGNVAASGMSIGHKGMMHAAKIMAAAAVELYLEPAHLVKVREEFDEKMMGRPYVPPIPMDVDPPQFEPED